jgi:hypothetical protein
MKTTRLFLKHIAEPTVYAIEADEGGVTVGALEVTSDMTAGGLCPHMLPTLPLNGRAEVLAYLEESRHLYEPYEPDCGNVHHLMHDLLNYERDHREAADTYAMADSKAKALKKEMEAKAARIHDLLRRINDRESLPLFESV